MLRVPTKAQFAVLRDSLSKEHTAPALFIELLLRTGMRQGEVARLVLDDLDLDLGRVRVRSLKNSRPRDLKLPEHFVKRFSSWIQVNKVCRGERLINYMPRSGNDPASATRELRHAWKRLVRELFGETYDWPLHSLRHSWALRFYERTKDVKLLQTVIGHKLPSSTWVYVVHHDSQNAEQDYIEAIG